MPSLGPSSSPPPPSLPSILLVGCGTMGGALVAGWLDQGLHPGEIIAVEPDAARAEILAGKQIGVIAGANSLPDGLAPQVVIFAVKPQLIDGVVPAYARLAGCHPVFLSVAAGTPIARFTAHLGDRAAIVRAMPNTPAAVRQAATVCVANATVMPTQRALCGRLLGAVGTVHWVDDEALIDPVTAVSGSGPAYVFLLVEALAQAGVAAGLPPELSQQLARATVTGAAALLAASPLAAETLRHQVTSPGGTTAAALALLMADDGLPLLMTRAVAAATTRSRQLAGG